MKFQTKIPRRSTITLFHKPNKKTTQNKKYAKTSLHMNGMVKKMQRAITKTSLMIGIS